MLSVEGLSVSYGLLRAVQRLDLTIAAGEVVSLIGANGAGKSSTLKALMGLAPIREGRVSIGGRTISHIAAAQRVRSGLALSPEGRHVFPDMSVAENLLAGAAGASRAVADRRTAKVFAMFPKLMARQSQLAGTMSGGEQQMLAIARALMSSPRVLLLDEPTLGLAPIIVDELAELIETLRAGGLAILLAEQNVEFALAVSNRGYVLDAGTLVKSGDSRALASDPAILAAYLGL